MDNLGDRMKNQYECRTRFMLPRRTYTIIRIDGKAFHTFTKNCDKPNDVGLAASLDYAAIQLCNEVQGCKFAYLQSDEISILLTDFETITTEAWFDANVQKLVSVSASIVTAAFNFAFSRDNNFNTAYFDARVFTIPDPTEVENYFIWRQQDATKNSIQSLAQANFSHKELQDVSCDKLQEMLWQKKAINWNDLLAYWKRGRCIIKTEEGWIIDAGIPVFTQERNYLTSRIPKII
jgi:tRNA(His) guanylyltransferase